MKTTAASSAPALAPISYRERHELIDVIRGFALFGVLLSNLTFNVFFATTRQTFASLPTASLEMPAVYLYRYFVQGKFMFLPVRLPVMVGVVSLAAAYLAGLVLAYQRPSARRILAHLAPVGRMALTNYLTHSVFFVLIMSGVGLGLAGKFGPALTLPIALVIFAVQVVASHYWLRHFRFGPAEWLWRTLTYARRQPFRRFAGPESVETYVARRVPM